MIAAALRVTPHDQRQHREDHDLRLPYQYGFRGCRVALAVWALAVRPEPPAYLRSWGLLLGILRLRTGGIGIPYLVHVTANATIGTLAITLLS